MGIWGHAKGLPLSPGRAVPGCCPKETPGPSFHLTCEGVHEGSELSRRPLCSASPCQPPAIRQIGPSAGLRTLWGLRLGALGAGEPRPPRICSTQHMGRSHKERNSSGMLPAPPACPPGLGGVRAALAVPRCRSSGLYHPGSRASPGRKNQLIQMMVLEKRAVWGWGKQMRRVRPGPAPNTSTAGAGRWPGCRDPTIPITAHGPVLPREPHPAGC